MLRGQRGDGADELLKLGYYLSFTGVITFKNARKALEIIRETPLDRLMIERTPPIWRPNRIADAAIRRYMYTVWRKRLRRSKGWKRKRSKGSQQKTAKDCLGLRDEKFENFIIKVTKRTALW